MYITELPGGIVITMVLKSKSISQNNQIDHIFLRYYLKGSNTCCILMLLEKVVYPSKYRVKLNVLG